VTWLRALSRARRALLATLVACVAFVAIVVIRPGGPVATRDLDDAAQALAPLLVAVPACIWAATRTSGRRRRFWVLLALFAGSWGLGQLVWTYLEIVSGNQPGTDSWATLGFLMAPVFGAAAIVSYPSTRLHWAARLRALVDGLLIVSTLLFVSWSMAVDSGGLARSATDFVQKVTVLTYPATDIVLLALVATIVIRSLRSWHDPMCAVGACMVALLLGDSSSIYVGLSGTYSTGNLIDVFWFAAFLLLGVGALLPASGPADPAVQLKPPMWTEMTTYVALALAVAMGFVQIVRGHGFDSVEEMLVLISALLLILRSYLFVTENRSLLSRLERTISELEWLTLHDPLTGLANRVLYQDRLDQALAQRQATSRTVAVAYLDLDNFKDVNDSFGHDSGDELLRQVARRLSSSVREGDTLARLSGDEFAMLLTDAEDVRRIETLLRRLLTEVDQPFEVFDRSVSVSASIGFTVSDATVGADTLLRHADEAMYAAKNLGKDRVCRYEPSMHRGGDPLVTPGSRPRAAAERLLPGMPPWLVAQKGLA